MAGYCTLVLYFHSPAARENTTAHSCNIHPYCPLTHQIIYIYRACANTVYQASPRGEGPGHEARPVSQEIRSGPIPIRADRIR